MIHQSRGLMLAEEGIESIVATGAMLRYGGTLGCWILSLDVLWIGTICRDFEVKMMPIHEKSREKIQGLFRQERATLP